MKNAERLQNIKCFVMDMDGTIYLGPELFPCTKPFLKKVEESGRKAFFFTNNSSKNKMDYIQRLEGFGIPIAPQDLFTSTEVILDFLQKEHAGEPLYVVGTPNLESALREGGCTLVADDPKVVVVGFDTTLTYEKLDKATRFLENGAVFYGVHPDRVCPVDGGHNMPDCGLIVQVLEGATGRTARYFGKPERETLEYVIRKSGFAEEEIAFVGDRMYTDIAVAAGTKATSILVLTGETRPEDLAAYSYQPDLIAESLEELIPYL